MRGTVAAPPTHRSEAATSVSPCHHTRATSLAQYIQRCVRSMGCRPRARRLAACACLTMLFLTPPMDSMMENHVSVWDQLYTKDSPVDSATASEVRKASSSLRLKADSAAPESAQDACHVT